MLQKLLRLRPTGDYPLFVGPSLAGLVVGALGFAAALTPSMIPRSGLMQGLLGGMVFALAYGIGAGLVALWSWIFERELPMMRGARVTAFLVAALAVILPLAHVTAWQNGIHAAMGMPPVESARPFTILGVSILVALVLLLLGRLFRRLWRLIAAQLDPLVPRRLAISLGLVLAAMAFWALGNDVVLGRLLRLMDSSYAAVDQLISAEALPPEDPLKMGSAQSLIDWNGLGAEGRRWVLDQPDAAKIAEVTGRPTTEPLRIYAGLNNGLDADSRAKLALAEAVRTGAFDRKVLVIATPTGTGWMDPAGLQPLDYLTGGDVATIAVQYSYLPSWLSLFVQPEYGEETAEALFREVYGHWRQLPRDARPQIYLFGLSLGVRNGEMAVSWPDLMADPLDGALWVGPPFAARSWRQVLTGSPATSPAWAPRVRDGSVIRVRTQQGPTDPDPAPWGPMRVLYLEHPSDPIVFFSTDILWRAPAWVRGPKAPDVSADLRWHPLVTFLQLGFDMMTATTTPKGYGHVYSARDYLHAWNEVLETGWSADELRAAEQVLDDQGL